MKINLRIFFTTLFSTGMVLSGIAQHQAKVSNIPNSGTQERCGSGIIHQRLLQTDPKYVKRIQENEKKIQDIINSPDRVEETYTIPVVVHVLHKGEAVGTGTNISTAQINSAIANLNQCYGGQGSYPLDIKVQFQLAQRSPTCGSTTGIVRVNASGVADYATNGITMGDNEETIKAISKWPNGEYYNIWIVSEIDGNDGGWGTQGFAYFPGASSDVDGAVILYNAFGYDPTLTLGYNLKNGTNYNVTTNHELGHGLNLYHTFQGDGDGSGGQCPANTSCTTQGDLCCDTEAHNRNDGNCGATGTTCSGESIVNVVQNIMAYSSDHCQVQFTNDQKTRMRAAISGTRASLLSSPALLAVSGSAPSATKSCSPQTSNLVDNYGMGIYRLKIGAVEYGSSGTIADGGFRNNWCGSFNLNPNTSYAIEVDNGTLNPEKVKVYIDYNNDGDFSDAGEEVYSDAVSGNTHSGNFTTPASPTSGQALWVRVISDFNNITGPCYAPTYGQVEDFSVTFSSGGCTAPTVNTVPVSPSCNGGTNGSATANASGGTSPYTYLWNTGAVTQTISNIGAGTYTVTVTDDVGCSASRTAVVVNPSALSLSTTIQQPTCPNNDGSINLTVSGGTPSYTYNWSTGSVTQDIGSLAQGGYTVTVSDANGCTAVKATNLVRVCIPTTQVAASQCGQTISNFTGSFYCNAVTGAQDYEWEFTTGGTTVTKTRGTGSNTIAKTSIPGLKYATTYDVRVRAKVNNNWGEFGDVCQIIMGAFPTTQLNSTYCGAVNLALNSLIYCNAVSGASDYSYTITNNTGPAYSQTKTKGSNSLSMGLSAFTGLLYGETYNITVRAIVGGVMGPVGPTCQITFKTLPTTQLNTASCGAVDLSLNSLIYCNIVSGAQSYEFTITNNTGPVYNQTRTKGVNSLSIGLNLFPGLEYGETYNVTVKAIVNGVTSAAGAVCQITLKALPPTQLTPTSCGATGLSLGAYIYCLPISGSTDYNYTITNNTGPAYSQTRNKTNNSTSMKLSLFTGLTAGETYDVTVSSKINGVWSAPGPVCQITLAPSEQIVKTDHPERNNTANIIRSVSALDSNPKLLIFPNPSTNSGFSINLEGVEGEDNTIFVSILDMYGKCVWTETRQLAQGDQMTKINSEGSWAKGIYLVSVEVNGNLLKQKIVIE